MSNRNRLAIIVGSIFLCNLSIAQVSEEEARKDLLSFIGIDFLELYPSDSSYAFLVKKINENADLYVSVIQKEIKLPSDPIYLSHKDSLFYYGELMSVLAFINTQNSRQVLCGEYKKLGVMVDSFDVILRNVKDTKGQEWGDRYDVIDSAHGRLSNQQANILYVATLNLDTAFVSDCLERIDQVDVGLQYVMLRYLAAVANGNQRVISRLTDLYANAKYILFLNKDVKDTILSIGGVIPNVIHTLYVGLCDYRGHLLEGGKLEYYDNGWQPSVDLNDGTYYVQTKLDKIRLRMTYANATLEKSNVPINEGSLENGFYFETINTSVLLNDNHGNSPGEGAVQYYSGGWFGFGVTTFGIARKELLPGNYKFRMTYGHASNEKYQDIGEDSVVVFQTMPVEVKLINSQSSVMDTGKVKYYAGGWWDFGTTSNGVVSKELLPYNYKFRMTYAKASNEKYQDVGSNPVVVFQTVPVNVKLTNSQSVLMDTGKVQYYSGGWWDMGTTLGGVAVKELLPYNYKFRMTFDKASNEKYQDVGVNPEVVFQTVNARVNLKDSQGNSMDAGEVKYYSGGWWDLGTTSGGIASKELLPYNYKFRMTFAKTSNEKYQDIGTDPDVVFRTVQTRVELRNSQAALMDGGSVKYYSGGWWDFGSTSNGAVSKELLPYNYKFRMTYANGSNEKYQDTGVNPVVVFPTVSSVVRVLNLQGNPVNNADVKYYSGGWYPFGVTSGGTVSGELLPSNYKFRATAGSKTSEKYQDLSMNPVVILTLDVP